MATMDIFGGEDDHWWLDDLSSVFTDEGYHYHEFPQSSSDDTSDSDPSSSPSSDEAAARLPASRISISALSIEEQREYYARAARKSRLKKREAEKAKNNYIKNNEDVLNLILSENSKLVENEEARNMRLREVEAQLEESNMRLRRIETQMKEVMARGNRFHKRPAVDEMIPIEDDKTVRVALNKVAKLQDVVEEMSGFIEYRLNKIIMVVVVVVVYRTQNQVQSFYFRFLYIHSRFFMTRLRYVIL